MIISEENYLAGIFEQLKEMNKNIRDVKDAIYDVSESIEENTSAIDTLSPKIIKSLDAIKSQIYQL